jgi:hypothetical protein
MDYQRGAALYAVGEKSDSAFYYFTNVSINSEDSLLVAMAYTYMSMIQEDAGDHIGSQESALEGLHHLDEKNLTHQYCLSSLYNELGMSSVGLKSYDAAIEYYEQAIKYQPDSNYKSIFRNNKAVAYREKGDYMMALKLLEGILTKQKDNTVNYARALTNLANVKSLADSVYNPVPEYLYALGIRTREKDYIGMVASYRHLSAYYLKRNPVVALSYADTMYHLAIKINSAEEKIDALPKLVLLTSATESKKYFNEYRQLDDSIRTARNKSKNQYAAIRYQSEKNKSENLILHHENAEKELKLLRQRAWLFFLVPLVVFVIVFSYWQTRKKKQQLIWEAQAEIQDNKLKTSQKVHDIVANGLYRIMKEVEHKQQIDREELLDKMDYLYERSRDISYEYTDDISDAMKRISELITDFATSEIKIVIAGNHQDIWNQFTKETIEEIEQILLEMMVNMSKHSKAAHVALRFENINGALLISYRDDGVGFPKNIVPGNGLKSTEIRIRNLKGEITFIQESTTGASIKITIPTRNR